MVLELKRFVGGHRVVLKEYSSGMLVVYWRDADVSFGDRGVVWEGYDEGVARQQYHRTVMWALNRFEPEEA